MDAAVTTLGGSCLNVISLAYATEHQENCDDKIAILERSLTTMLEGTKVFKACFALAKRKGLILNA